jgi:hypothetical protein
MANVKCRRCSTALDNEPAVPFSLHRDKPFREAGQGADDDQEQERWSARHCPECGWLNAVKPPPGHWSLSRFAAAAPEEFSRLSDASDTEGTIRVLKAIRSDLVARVARIVTEYRRETCALIYALVRNMYEMEQSEGFTDVTIRELQQLLFVYLIVHGPLPIPNSDLPSVEPLAPPMREVVDLVYFLRVLDGTIKLGGYGVPLSLSGGVVTEGELDEESAWVTEVNLNHRVDPQLNWKQKREQLRTEGANPHIAGIEAYVYGYSVPDFVDVFSDIKKLARVARVGTDTSGEIITVDYDRAPPKLQALLEFYLVTPDRLRHHSSPSFFFAGEEAQRGDVEIMETAFEMDWLSYAPLLPAVYYDGKIHGAFVVSRFLLDRTETRANSAVAFRLHRAIEVARARYPDLMPVVSKAVRDYHAELEDKVAQAFSEAGMLALQNVTHYGKRALPCGEIDVLAIGQPVAGPPLLCVAEVKNTDVSFYKDTGARHAAETISRGSTQAARKSAWLQEHTQVVAELFPSLNQRTPLYVLPMVITRHMALPVEHGGVPVTSPYELGRIIAMLTGTPAASWRPDFRSAAKLTELRPRTDPASSLNNNGAQNRTLPNS